MFSITQQGLCFPNNFQNTIPTNLTISKQIFPHDRVIICTTPSKRNIFLMEFVRSEAQPEPYANTPNYGYSFYKLKLQKHEWK